MAASLQTTGDVQIRKQVFIPQETLDYPFDVTLVVEDGKEFKAHRSVLSEASPFFEKMLKSDMRESSEGVVRLEMLTELCLRDILEIIYTGSVQISAEDNAQEMIAMADYLVLLHLKTLAESYLVKNLNYSNAISTYYFGERYCCEDLICASKNFIMANFTTISKTEAFLNLASKEVKMWISIDEIDVRAEEDVFTLILMWIDREKSERKKYFCELLREVRLACVSRDYLLSDFVTNDLVNDNEGCMDLVKDAMKSIDATNYHYLRVKPRKSLETPVIVFHTDKRRKACYYPRENSWSRFYGPDLTDCGDGKVVSCHDEIYFIPDLIFYESDGPLRYDALSDSWESIPYMHAEQRIIRKVFVGNDDQIYVLSVNKLNGRTCRREYACVEVGHGKHLYFITKYKPESNSWEDISSFDMGSRVRICVVAKDNFIYFLGGLLAPSGDESKTLTDAADRYDLSTNSWDKIADLQVPRCNGYEAVAAVAYGKILIAGGRVEFGDLIAETYDERTNEWQIIPSPSLMQNKLPVSPSWMCADGKLFVFSRFINSRSQTGKIIKCFDPDSDSWKEITRIPLEVLPKVTLKRREYMVFACSMKALKKQDFFEQALFSEECSHKRLLDVGKCKCIIM